MSPTVHFHGWTFFAWYLLLPIQAALVQRGKLGWHRSPGGASVVLAAAHRRLIILASSAGLGAAVIHDWRAQGRVHPVLGYGLAIFLAAQVGFRLGPISPLGPALLSLLATMGRVLAPLYL